MRVKFTYPNLPLMKLSAWHKQRGDETFLYHSPDEADLIYCSKVFSDNYTKDDGRMLNAPEIVWSGSGYAITEKDGLEVYDPSKDDSLPDEIEHIMPDYSLYGIEDECFGFLTRGCPRGCPFCHVAGMQGRVAHKVADLNEFWNGQHLIHLNDPNILACKDWGVLLEQVARTKARVDFNQGVDARLLTKEKVEALNSCHVTGYHFAWDNPKDDLREKLLYAKQNLKGCGGHAAYVYILVNFNSTEEEDIMRVEYCKSIKLQPYVMTYRKGTESETLKKLRRYANNPYVCWATPTFEDYKASVRSERFGKTGIRKEKKKTI